MLYLLQDYYKQCGEEKYKQIMDKLAAAGVNMQRLQSYQQSYDEAMMQQQAQEEPAEAMGGEEE